MTENSSTNPLTHLGYRPLDPSAPAWLRDIARFLAIRSQFIISGNIADLVLMPAGGMAQPMTLKDAIMALLEVSGYEFLLCYDPFDNFQLHAPNERSVAAAKTATGLTVDNNGQIAASDKKLFETMRRLVHSRAPRGALLLEHTARLGEEHGRELFGQSLKLSQSAPQLPMPDGRARFNPIFWITDEPTNLPAWLTLRNERIRTQSIPKPDIDARLKAATVLTKAMLGFPETPENKRIQIVHDLARATEGFTLSALVSMTQLARDQGFDFLHALDAVRLYKLGVTDNPWSKPALQQLIRGAEPIIQNQVKGQKQAIAKSIDDLKRSVKDYSGAQFSADPLSSQPKAVLFFAGPTGVGKTELAKAITTLLFGDERAYIRFDMSEFAQEHTEARLIGAPPGYTGYDAGGELTKAVRERPFSVILFDEIEKAHPKIFDKFLQILQDGRLTDGRGETAYFSDSIIIFTSNLGIYRERPGGERVENVDPSMPYEEIDAKVRNEIENFFKYKLGRPEIYGRLGDNISVFNFISVEIAEQILERQIGNIRNRVQFKDGIALEISPDVMEKLSALCTRDLTKGGRGIGTRLESVFLNPLSRSLFDMSPPPSRGSVVFVTDIIAEDASYRLAVSVTSA